MLTAPARITSEPFNNVLAAMRDVVVRTIVAAIPVFRAKCAAMARMFKDICAAIIVVIAAVATIEVDATITDLAASAASRSQAYLASTLLG
jgi:hypothetical protein